MSNVLTLLITLLSGGEALYLAYVSRQPSCAFLRTYEITGIRLSRNVVVVL